MVQPVRQHFSFRDYVELEELSTVKHEFLDGTVWAMAGGSPDHAAIAMNVGALLSAQLRDRPCRVYSSDLRVRVQATGLGTYPDVTVICGHLEVDPEDPKGHTAVNPSLIVEVLSPSTEEYDRGEKLSHYQQVASLDTIVLVSQERPQIEVWLRENDGWERHASEGVDSSAELRAIGCTLPLEEVYRNPLAEP